MGLYINPKEGTKEEWLAENAVELESEPTKHRVGPALVVLLVDNQTFTAAAVAYNRRELDRFIWSFQNGDARRHSWYLAEEDDIRAVCRGDKGAEPYLAMIE